MGSKQIIILVLIVCTPLGLLAWLGHRFAQQEQQMVQQQFHDLLADELKKTDGLIVNHFQRVQRELLHETELTEIDTASLRAFVRQHPRVEQLFLLEADGRLVHPPSNAPRNHSEIEFLQRTKQFLLDRDIIRAIDSQQLGQGGYPVGNNKSKVTPNSGDQNSGDSKNESGDSENESGDGEKEPSQIVLEKPTSAETIPLEESHGWYVWYWGRGVNLIFFRRLKSGHVLGLELTRSRWMSDLIEQLPQTITLENQKEDAVKKSSLSASRIQLVDSGANVVYQWGTVQPEEGAEPLAEIPLTAPLSSWRLRYFVDQKTFASVGRTTQFNLFTTLGIAAIVLTGLAVYFYRESSREVREANTRVNFVNQVSHELKTPLTNIRLYADLLENDLQLFDEQERLVPCERLQVIVSESGRLSRLIGNVLTFAKIQRKQIVSFVKPGVIDETIERVLERFRPVLSQKNIELRFQSGASDRVQFDADSLEQILVNLLSNIEKYASDGPTVEITSEQSPSEKTAVSKKTLITVSDSGPGISASLHEKVFQPFHRLSDGLEETTGAGIGLSIARDLARTHGGDVRILPSKCGATFLIELPTPSADSNGSAGNSSAGNSSAKNNSSNNGENR